ncbi:lateral signaling target protein 2 homolog [Lineus longissimus]|uniref:lateral signaling target protein 2 homolog n=1 Tax=Lineus longissimus TaxID=88925 RepID=UPI00315CA21F
MMSASSNKRVKNGSESSRRPNRNGQERHRSRSPSYRDRPTGMRKGPDSHREKSYSSADSKEIRKRPIHPPIRHRSDQSDRDEEQEFERQGVDEIHVELPPSTITEKKAEQVKTNTNNSLSGIKKQQQQHRAGSVPTSDEDTSIEDEEDASQQIEERSSLSSTKRMTASCSKSSTMDKKTVFGKFKINHTHAWCDDSILQLHVVDTTKQQQQQQQQQQQEQQEYAYEEIRKVFRGRAEHRQEQCPVKRIH